MSIPSWFLTIPITVVNHFTSWAIFQSLFWCFDAKITYSRSSIHFDHISKWYIFQNNFTFLITHFDQEFRQNRTYTCRKNLRAGLKKVGILPNLNMDCPSWKITCLESRNLWYWKHSLLMRCTNYKINSFIKIHEPQ